MGAASRYWKLVRLDARGRHRIEEIVSIKTFFRRQFPELKNQLDASDRLVQQQLLALRRGDWQAAAEEASNHLLADCCLRCFISSQIEQVCLQLEVQFGGEHGFTRYDLFPFVLDDTLDELRAIEQPNFSRSNSITYQPMAAKILQTFDRERASLSTWTNRLVKHHRELNAFLLERGVYLVSDWAILNDTTPKQVQRILAEFHNLSSVEVERARSLLESYHRVYRRARLKQRQTGIRGKCPPPSLEQLQQIASLVNQKADLTFSPETILSRLQDLAEHLRQYRIYVRGGSGVRESLDNPETKLSFERRQASLASAGSDDEQEQVEFLRSYRQQFIDCLDRAIERMTEARLSRLQRQVPKTEQFLTALELFHCQGRSMGEIAPLVGLQAQYQVSRLLQLKAFRADIRQQMLQDLAARTMKTAGNYTDPDQLLERSRQVEAALEEQIDAAIQEAKMEASTSKTLTSSSLFAQRLCYYLEKLRRNSS